MKMSMKYILCFTTMVLFFIASPCNADENTFAIENSTNTFAPYWSPDGTYIAYSSSTGNSLENLSGCLSREGGMDKEKLTSENESGGFFFDPWSPEGDLLLYISNLTGNYELWTMHPDGSGKKKLTEGVFLENYLLGLRGWEADWGPDGSKIVYVSASSENGDIWDMVEKEDGTKQRMLNKSNICKDSDIWIINSDGSENIRLTDSNGPYLEPQWQPEGNIIAYVSNNPETEGIWIMESDGSEKSRIFEGKAYDIAWSPEGDEIAYVKTNNNHTTSLWVMNADGSNQRKITNDSGYYKAHSFPVWSPDADKIVFNYGDIGEYGIWITDHKGNEKLQIGRGFMPQWSPEGNKIAYTSAKNKRRSISMIELDDKSLPDSTKMPEKSPSFGLLESIIMLYALFIMHKK
ncbi:hypothetical protein EFE41_00575 [Methanohalophilus portucalensis FDF-1]|uniref:WD40-like beta propeller protein n=4 Tax=Methanohalophilus portucalensis TaxID=39664 RepID=A0A1L9C6J0_9EURY|nr:WD40-like beta propeller protein [Methanohalophilus portucalensis FDF-1]RNI13120.1 hypothetical protein EFE41_00575 [Methanohalophilus portucalensis FDF-1]